MINIIDFKDKTSTKDVWEITVEEVRTYRVVYDEPVSADVARELFLTEDYQDILDESPGVVLIVKEVI